MAVILVGLAVVFAVFAVVGVLHETGLLDILCDIWDDLANRNDRGKLKRPSDKFVAR
ncbi:MAG TPA: hypothetical protein VG225_04625 [Terracidiphilus sp.]|jgi:hypothetical protein|nr:hypothetical protein [Terracidiphilus sp.]